MIGRKLSNLLFAFVFLQCDSKIFLSPFPTRRCGRKFLVRMKASLSGPSVLST
jgi:hypothetical protein